MKEKKIYMLFTDDGKACVFGDDESRPWTKKRSTAINQAKHLKSRFPDHKYAVVAANLATVWEI